MAAVKLHNFLSSFYRVKAFSFDSLTATLLMNLKMYNAILTLSERKEKYYGEKRMGRLRERERKARDRYPSRRKRE